MVGDLKAFGAGKEVIEQWTKQSEQKPDHFPVMAKNWPVLDLFLACQTQWRVGGMDGVPLGLDYAGVEASARCMGVDMSSEMFEGLRIMESAALDEMTKRQRQ